MFYFSFQSVHHDLFEIIVNEEKRIVMMMMVMRNSTVLVVVLVVGKIFLRSNIRSKTTC
jgi:hypothetical protein